MKKILIIALLLIALVGCEDKEKITVCTTNYDGIEIENVIQSKGEQVTTVIYQTTITVEDTLAPYLTATAEEYAKNFVGVGGITYEYDVNKNTLKEVTTVEYLKVNYEDLVKLGLLELEDGVIPTPLYIEYEDILANMKSLGCECKVKR